VSVEVDVSAMGPRQVKGLICACLLTLAPAGANAQAPPPGAPGPIPGKAAAFEGPDRSPDGLELSRFTVSSPLFGIRVGSTLYVAFALKNATDRLVRLGGGGPSLAVRIEAGGKEEQRTLQPQRSATDLNPGHTTMFTFTVKPDLVGKWHVSPVYEIGGHAGPARWHELEFDVAAPQEGGLLSSRITRTVRPPARHETLLGICSDSGTLPHGLSVHITVEGLQPPRVGDTLKVKFTYQNLWVDRPALFGRKGVFVAARHSPKGKLDQGRRDFGHQLPYVVLRAYSPTRTIAFEDSLLVDAPGTWVFWPSFEIDGSEAPERWCAVSLDVEE
jgi:hypothetical protein